MKVEETGRSETVVRRTTSEEKWTSRKVSSNLERCHHCTESRRFAYSRAIVSQSEHVYLTLENPNVAFIDGQMLIVPRAHGDASTVNDQDESVYAEIRNYQKALVRFM